MKISDVPIEHRIKHLQPIFSLSKGNKYFCSAGINGEIKLWDSSYAHVRTVKKHAGSVTSAKFSLDSAFLATAGDDGKVIVFDEDAKEILRTIKHPCDVTHVAWTPDFLLSSNLAGEVLVSKISDGFTEFRRLCDHESGVLGMAVHGPLLCTYSEDTVALYENFNLRARRSIEKGGVVLENLQCRLSFSPSGKFISLGLQFNRRLPTVDVLDQELRTVYSLVGHVAPCEVSAFCPHALRRGRQHAVLAVASQDLSVSLWTTLSPRPFLLVKNLTEMPVLDLMWDGLVLYASSYDGAVKKIEFEEDELGTRGEFEEEDEFEMPLSEENVEIQRRYEGRAEKLDFGERVEVIKLSEFRLVDVDDRVDDRVVGGVNDIKAAEGEVNDIKAADNKAAEVNLAEGKAAEDKPANDKAADKPTDNKTTDKLTDNNLPDKPTEDNKLTELVKVSGPKRITPVMLDKPNSATVSKLTNSSLLVLYDSNIPDKLKLSRSLPFSTTKGDFRVELTPACLSVFRASRLLYSIQGPCAKVAVNDDLLVVYTAHVQIYHLHTGTLAMPFIAIRLACLDLLGSRVLLLDAYGDFTVLSLAATGPGAVAGKLPRTKGLARLQLSDSHFLLAEYQGGELLFYSTGLGLWLAINPGFSSITTGQVDIHNDYDETIAELELSFMHYLTVGDQGRMKGVVKQFVALLMRIKRLEEYVEYKIRRMLLGIEDKEFVRGVLEEMNREGVFQRFVLTYLG